MKQKPHKYGIKIWVLADCSNSYVHNLQVYTGKQGNAAECEQGRRVVMDMVQHLGKGYGITADNFFTSLPLADDLLARKLTFCGTVRKDKAFIPAQLLPDRQRAEHSSIFGFTNKHTIVSYVPKKGKSVILLSTKHHDHSISGPDDDFKPDVILHYNSTKGAVDNFDKMAAEYTVRRRTVRWPMVLFMNMIDTAGSNAFCLFRHKFPDWKSNKLDRRRHFLLQMGKELIIPNIHRRLDTPRGVPRMVLQDMRILDPDHQPTAPVHHKLQGRCAECPRKRDRKIRTQCDACHLFFCKDHLQKTTQQLCSTCHNV